MLPGIPKILVYLRQLQRVEIRLQCYLVLFIPWILIKLPVPVAARSKA